LPKTGTVPNDVYDEMRTNATKRRIAKKGMSILASSAFNISIFKGEFSFFVLGFDLKKKGKSLSSLIGSKRRADKNLCIKGLVSFMDVFILKREKKQILRKNLTKQCFLESIIS
jgi:hypothetical protein